MFYYSFLFLEVDAAVERLFAFVAFGDEVEADSADVFLCAEGIGVIDFIALDFELE